MKRNLLAALTLVFAVLFAAAAFAELPKAPVKIGVVLPTSGAIAYDGNLALNGVKMAVDEINKAGGIQGNEIQLFVEDSAGIPATAVAAMEKLVGMEKVVAVIGDFGSSCTLAMMDVAQRAKVPLITPVSLAPKITEMGYIWMFRGCDNSAMIAAAFTKWAVQEKKADKWAYIAINTDYGRGSVEAFNAQLEKLGARVVFTEYFNQGETDYYPIVTKLSATDANGLCLFGETVDLSRVVAQYHEMGIGDRMLIMDPTSGTFNAKFIELSGENAEGIVVRAASWPPSRLPPPKSSSPTTGQGTTPTLKSTPRRDTTAPACCLLPLTRPVRSIRKRCGSSFPQFSTKAPRGKRTLTGRTS